MKPSEYAAGVNPAHLTELVYARVSEDAEYVTEYRAVFYKDRVRWEDHPWSGGTSGGADFQDEWTIESRSSPTAPWYPAGRSGNGARSLRVEGMFESRKAAAAEASNQLCGRVARLEAQAAHLRKVATRFAAEAVSP